MAKVVEGRPAKMGFRMPAEWEPHEQCWMGWPVLSFPLHFFLLLPPCMPLLPIFVLVLHRCYDVQGWMLLCSDPSGPSLVMFVQPSLGLELRIEIRFISLHNSQLGSRVA
jgi:hypothetical protein